MMSETFVNVMHVMMSQISYILVMMSQTNVMHVMMSQIVDVTNPIRVVNRRPHLQFGRSTTPGIDNCLSLPNIFINVHLTRIFKTF